MYDEFEELKYGMKFGEGIIKEDDVSEEHFVITSKKAPSSRHEAEKVHHAERRRRDRKQKVSRMGPTKKLVRDGFQDAGSLKKINLQRGMIVRPFRDGLYVLNGETLKRGLRERRDIMRDGLGDKLHSLDRLRMREQMTEEIYEEDDDKVIADTIEGLGTEPVPAKKEVKLDLHLVFELAETEAWKVQQAFNRYGDRAWFIARMKRIADWVNSQIAMVTEN